jgi:3-methyladenine DNA glycosylase AlkD
MKKKAAPKAAAKESSVVSAKDALQWLERRGTKKNVAELKRYGITATRPFGVTVGDIKGYARQVGTDHALAQALWASGRYEARLLAAFVDDPARVTVRQMDAWAAGFDNWGIVDTVCFSLFDRTRHAWDMVPRWAKKTPEFTRRAAFALLWSLSVHDKDASDEAFLKCLPLIEWGARDDRHFVKKAVNMALRAIGKRNAALNAVAIETAERLAKLDEAAPRWVGRHALRELTSPAVRKRLARGRS